MGSKVSHQNSNNDRSFVINKITDKTNSSCTSNGIKVYYPADKDKAICPILGCHHYKIYYPNLLNYRCKDCRKEFPNLLPEDKNYCANGCVTNLDKIRHTIKCDRCMLQFCKNCFDLHSYKHHCQCSDCKLRSLETPYDGVMLINSKCNLCKLIIPLNDKTAISWLRDRYFISDRLQEIGTDMKGFSISGHKNIKNAYEGALCLECQIKLKTSTSYIGNLVTEYKIFGFIRNIRIPEFTYTNHDDKKVYYHCAIMLKINEEDLIECLEIYLIDNKFNHQGIAELLSLDLNTNLNIAGIRSTIREILSGEEKDHKKQRLIALFDAIWNEYVNHLMITRLNAPLIRMIYNYSPTSEYSEFLPEVAK